MHWMHGIVYIKALQTHFRYIDGLRSKWFMLINMGIWCVFEFWLCMNWGELNWARGGGGGRGGGWKKKEKEGFLLLLPPPPILMLTPIEARSKLKNSSWNTCFADQYIDHREWSYIWCNDRLTGKSAGLALLLAGQWVHWWICYY